MADEASLRAAAAAALARFGEGVQQIRQRGIAARAAIESAAATVQSPDGAVRVTVRANGSLAEVSFGPAADNRSRDSLAALVVETSRAAHAAALAEAQARVADIEGADSEPVAVLRRAHDTLVPPPDEGGFSGRGR